MKAKIKKLDLPLLMAMIIFLIFGLIMIFSASNVSAVLRYQVSTTHFFKRQLLFVLAALFVGFTIVLRVPTKKYRFFGVLYFLGSILALFLIFVYGKVAGGAKSWYALGSLSVNLQPIEFAKTALIIFLSIYYSVVYRLKSRPMVVTIIPFILTAIMAVLIVLQPDLGGALIICALMGLLYLTLPDDKKSKSNLIKIIIVGGVLFLAVLLYSGSNFIDSYQLKRLQFSHPCSRYIEDTGYQVCNGFIAMHNGGFLGRGLGKSTQKYLYLPEAHTDFIFPIIVEELGYLGGLVVVFGYAFMLYRILNIARRAKTIQNQVLCYGCLFYMLIHIMINLLGVLALMPLTGVPLPFLSYGGSYTVNLILMVFIVERVSIENNSVK